MCCSLNCAWSPSKTSTMFLLASTRSKVCIALNGTFRGSVLDSGRAWIAQHELEVHCKAEGVTGKFLLWHAQRLATRHCSLRCLLVATADTSATACFRFVCSVLAVPVPEPLNEEELDGQDNQELQYRLVLNCSSMTVCSPQAAWSLRQLAYACTRPVGCLQNEKLQHR